MRKRYKAVLVTVLSLVRHQSEIVHLHSHAAVLRIVHSGPVPLTDVPGWAQQAVSHEYRLGIVQGFSDRLFHPNQPVTSAQLAALLVREFGISIGSGVNTRNFADVQPCLWAYRDIEAVAPYMDYFTGPSGQPFFEPGKPAVREDAFVALVEPEDWPVRHQIRRCFPNSPTPATSRRT